METNNNKSNADKALEQCDKRKRQAKKFADDIFKEFAKEDTKVKVTISFEEKCQGIDVEAEFSYISK